MESRARLLMALGLGCTFAGLAIASTFARAAGGAILLLGWAMLGYAVHRLGRLG
ncbi:hypothetical protein LZC95_15660 [Pendulispora brunnea]|uniref:Uncharacterized protein n=1 Tax=Pendulispora brunnea TaxID=2905690 RepID=A0ABZ2KHX0_9BACT